jgi:integrase
MIRKARTLASGKVWVGYYYDGRGDDGKRKEIPLGTDINAAKRKWAELDCMPAPDETGLMRWIFSEYAREEIPGKSPGTQRNYKANIAMLDSVFGEMHIDSIEPGHVAQYRKLRSKKAPVVANREIALLSAIFNFARDAGYTAKGNPCRGVRKNKETPRDYYAEDDVLDAVRACACQEMRDALDLAYLTGQRPADVLKMRWADIRDGALEIRQNKTAKRLRIAVEGALSALLSGIRSRAVAGMTIVATANGQPLTNHMRRSRFDAARAQAAENAVAAGDMVLAARIRQFQMRDTRAKTATDTDTLEHASELLGHTDKAVTRKVYRRKGEAVGPLK